jgi:hypothetical protein
MSLNGLEPQRLAPLGCCIGIELLGITWVVLTMKEFSSLYLRGSDEESLDDSGVLMGAFLTTTLPVGIVGTRGTIVEWAIWGEIVELGPTDCMFRPTDDMVEIMVVPVK